MKRFACLLGFLITIGGVGAASASDYLGCQLKYGEYPGVKSLPKPKIVRVSPDSYGPGAPQLTDVKTSIGPLHFEDERAGNRILIKGAEVVLPLEAREGPIEYGRVYDLKGSLMIAIIKKSANGRPLEIQLLVDKDGQLVKSNVSALMPPPAGHCSLADD